MATPVRSMSSRAVQAERTRQQILATAQRLFAERGYDATSLQMIADEMGLTKAAVYYHFRAKNEILQAHRQYAAMAATDPAARRDKLDDSATLRQRGLALIFGDNPTGAQRLAASAAFFIPECLPDLVDLTDEELREALQTMVLHLLRVPSGPRDQPVIRGDEELRGAPGR